jgi:hypothetical protein
VKFSKSFPVSSFFEHFFYLLVLSCFVCLFSSFVSFILFAFLLASCSLYWALLSLGSVLVPMATFRSELWECSLSDYTILYNFAPNLQRVHSVCYFSRFFTLNKKKKSPHLSQKLRTKFTCCHWRWQRLQTYVTRIVVSLFVCVFCERKFIQIVTQTNIHTLCLIGCCFCPRWPEFLLKLSKIFK